MKNKETLFSKNNYDVQIEEILDNKEFNDSRNNINGIKKSNYKGKVVIAILLVIAIIAIVMLFNGTITI